MSWSYTSASPLCLHMHVMERSFLQGVAFFSRHESPLMGQSPFRVESSLWTSDQSDAETSI